VICDAIEQAAQEAVDNGIITPNEEGVFRLNNNSPVIEVDGVPIRVGGRVMNGRVRLSTASRLGL
jgi:hypothetical protein